MSLATLVAVVVLNWRMDLQVGGSARCNKSLLVAPQKERKLSSSDNKGNEKLSIMEKPGES